MTLQTFTDKPDEVKIFNLLMCAADRFSIEWAIPNSNNSLLTKFTVYLKRMDESEY
jgi:hypothetical protein